MVSGPDLAAVEVAGWAREVVLVEEAAAAGLVVDSGPVEEEGVDPARLVEVVDRAGAVVAVES